MLDALFVVAEESGRTPSQVALNWVLCQPGVTALILGVRTMAQLDDNLGASGWTLSAEQLQRLNTASANPALYPHDFTADAQQHR